MKVELPFFDPIDMTNLKEEYRAEIDYKGKNILLDINFTSKSLDAEKVNFIATQLENLDDLDAKNRKEIIEESKDGFIVKDYIDDSMDMMEKEDLKEIFKNVDKTKSKKEQTFDALYLNRVGFYPEEEKLCIICDYTFNEALLDDLLVVSRDSKGEFVSIGVEN